MNRSFLALGDSYTIGEQVPLYESFPYQTVQLLRKKGIPFYAPEILAKTGWTTDELLAAISDHQFLPSYDIVTLLIGVNNQYRGRSIEEFKKEFQVLLAKAIALAGGLPKNVFVLSIPDWGITPFAADRDRLKIAKEMDAFNAVCAENAALNKVTFVDNDASLRADGVHAEFIAPDGLHPSGKEYAKWAVRLAELIH